MAVVTPARQAAARTLRAVSRGRRLDRALEEAAAGLSPEDRRWVQDAAYGTLRLRGRLDHLLELHLPRGLSSLPPPVPDPLRLGAYQLLYMDGVPPYAALSQTVEQLRESAGEGMARLANGVLRSLQREGGEPARFPDFHADPLGHLASWGSHPRWLLERWVDRWGVEEVRALVEWNNTPPPLYLHPLGVSLTEARERLGALGQEAREAGEGAPCLRLEPGTHPATALASVPGIIQDPGAALVAVYADPPPGVWVADLCAAPGGKALALASRGAYVLAADRSFSRLRLVRENGMRVGKRVGLVAALAQLPPLRRAPFVLLDVPCTGTGTLRRHPDARWRLEPGSVERLAELQASILGAGAGLVPPGGHLVYSTCTLEGEENEAQVEAFLKRHPGFAIQETGVVPTRLLDGEGRLLILPHRSGFDGAFAARMVRRG